MESPREDPLSVAPSPQTTRPWLACHCTLLAREETKVGDFEIAKSGRECILRLQQGMMADWSDRRAAEVEERESA